MSLFVSLTLAVLAFVFITYPFFKRRAPAVNQVEDDKLLELYSKRNTTYSMLKELEFDLQSGILTAEDYGDLETRYKKKAVSILRNIDDFQNDTDVEGEIERGVLELRRGKEQFCSKCGMKRKKDDRFCSHCGSRLSQGGRVD